MKADELLEAMARAVFDRTWHGPPGDGVIQAYGEDIQAALRVFIEATGGREYWEIAMREIAEDGHRFLPRNIGLLLELANLEGK